MTTPWGTHTPIWASSTLTWAKAFHGKTSVLPNGHTGWHAAWHIMLSVERHSKRWLSFRWFLHNLKNIKHMGVLSTLRPPMPLLLICAGFKPKKKAGAQRCLAREVGKFRNPCDCSTVACICIAKENWLNSVDGVARLSLNVQSPNFREAQLYNPYNPLSESLRNHSFH